MTQFAELDIIFDLSSRLERFKIVESGKSFNFRCPVCGDSRQSKFKARGWFVFYPKYDTFFFKCFNCDASMGFPRFLKLYYPDEYKKYRLSTITNKSGTGRNNSKFTYTLKRPQNKYGATTKTASNNNSNTEEKYLKQAKASSVAMSYLERRKIPRQVWNNIWYTEDFEKLVKNFDINKKYENRKLPNDKRIVLKMIDENGNVIGLQGRSLDADASLRYITCMFRDSSKVFGLDRIDKSKKIIVTEGAIDSLFLDNAIAVNGGDAKILQTLTCLPKQNLVVAFDNEPRSVDTVARIKKAIDAGLSIVIWSGLNTECKDINDMVLSGIDRRKIQDYILDNNFKGARAILKLNSWKKI